MNYVRLNNSSGEPVAYVEDDKTNSIDAVVRLGAFFKFVCWSPDKLEAETYGEVFGVAPLIHLRDIWVIEIDEYGGIEPWAC